MKREGDLPPVAKMPSTPEIEERERALALLRRIEEDLPRLEALRIKGKLETEDPRRVEDWFYTLRIMKNYLNWDLEIGMGIAREKGLYAALDEAHEAMVRLEKDGEG